MKLLKLIVLALFGGPVALFVLLVLLGFILCVLPFGTICFVAWRYYSFREEKERMKRKTEVRLAQIKPLHVVE